MTTYDNWKQSVPGIDGYQLLEIQEEITTEEYKELLLECFIDDPDIDALNVSVAESRYAQAMKDKLEEWALKRLEEKQEYDDYD